MDDEFLTSAHLRHRYKVTGKTLREWELNGTIPPADRIGTGQLDRHVRSEVSCIEVVGRHVQYVLSAGRVGIKAVDNVVTEARGEHEQIVAGTTRHDIVAGATGYAVVTGAAIDIVAAGPTGHDVIAAGAA